METEVDPVVDQDLAKLEENGVKQIKDTIYKLYGIWDEFGLEPDQKSQRASKVWEHVLKLLSDILNEEITYNKDVKERVKNYANKLIELCNSLSIPPKTYEGPLIKKEENLRRELDSLTKLRNQRMRAYQNLRSTELKYCQSLDLPNHQLPPVLGVPSEENIKELEQNVMQLKIEKERRHAKLSRMRKELTTIWEITEIEPESPLVKSMLQSSEDFPLSNETFKALEEAIASAQVKKAKLENLRKELLEKLSVLWERLKVEEKKRKDFLSKHADCRLSTIKSIEEELSRCEKIKRDNIKLFVQSLQEELINLWSSCYASEQQKRQFQFFKTPDTMDDAVLTAFDAEVDEWKKYYDEVKPILKKIAKRQELFELMVVFENKATDPNRFKNRKGNLLKEEKERKKLQRDLPALENEIFLDISAYEEQKGQPFLYYGEDYRAFVTNQWEARKAQKESEKLERQKQHYIQLQNEVTIGTPSKRPLMTTPKSAPSKLFKSNLGIPCTPSMSVSRRVPPRTVGRPGTMPSPLSNQSKRLVSKTVGKLTQSIRSTSFRPNAIQSKDQRVLRERNQLLSLKTKKESSPNATSYSDFVKDLNATGRCSSRSSVLSTKKPGGTRISLNSSKSKRKSASKSLRRSTRNSSKITPNLTPARGKFGLPFLI